LKNKVWTLDDQLLIEKIEDKENMNSSVMDNNMITSRLLRRYGGDYVKNIHSRLDKNSTHLKK